MSTDNTTIENTPLRGVTLKILLAIITSTSITVGSVLAGYYGIQKKDEIQDLQIETLKLEQQKTDIELHDLKLQINQKQDKK